MVQTIQQPLSEIDEDEALQKILKGTATVTGETFFSALVENLSSAMHTHSAWVTEYIPTTRQIRALAFWSDGNLLCDILLDIAGTPCEVVIEKAELVHYADNLIELFPHNPFIKKFQAASYMGVPMMDPGDRILGHLAVMDTRPMPRAPRGLTIFQIFAARASAELQRIHAEADVRRREKKYRRIIETAGEGFLLMDEEYKITDVNNAFCKLCGYSRNEVIGKNPLDFSPDHDADFLLLNSKHIFSEASEAFESTLVSKAGRKIPILVHSSMATDDQGDIIGRMAFVTDLTPQKKSLILAAEIQKGLLPREKPSIDGIDIDGRNVSCNEIGGDYYDFFWDKSCQNQGFGIVVGDVMGHGVDAALIMTSARTFLHLNDSQCGSMTQIVSNLNRHLAQDLFNTSRFMTLFYMKLDPMTKMLRWVRAGHEPSLLYDPAQNRFTEIKGAGMALGIDENYDYTENALSSLKCGQILAIGTDGIWESRNRGGTAYGKKRFRDVISKNAYLNASEIIDAVFNSLNAFTRGRRQEDDMTLVVIKINK